LNITTVVNFVGLTELGYLRRGVRAQTRRQLNASQFVFLPTCSARLQSELQFELREVGNVLEP
jgi:hypothetical protein